MARIQILELPMIHHGDETETPFAIIIDQVATPAEAGRIRANLSDTKAAQVLGARQILVFEDTIDIPANWAYADDHGNFEGGTIRIKVEPDLGEFSDKVQDALADAQRKCAAALPRCR